MIDRGKEFSISYPLISSLLSFRKAEQIRMKEWAPCCYIEVKVSVIPRQNLLYFRVDGSPTTRTQPRQDFSCACVILFISALTLLWPRASGLWNVEMACVKSKRERRENVWGLPRGFSDKRHRSKIAKNVETILFQNTDSRQKLTEKKRQFATATTQLKQ